MCRCRYYGAHITRGISGCVRVVIRLVALQLGISGRLEFGSDTKVNPLTANGHERLLAKDKEEY